MVFPIISEESFFPARQANFLEHIAYFSFESLKVIISGELEKIISKRDSTWQELQAGERDFVPEIQYLYLKNSSSFTFNLQLNKKILNNCFRVKIIMAIRTDILGGKNFNPKNGLQKKKTVKR